MAKKTTITLTEKDYTEATSKVTDELMKKPGAGASIMLMTILVFALLHKELFGEEEESKPETDAETLLVNRVNSNETSLD